MKYDKHIQHKLEDIAEMRTFEDLINSLTISEEDKRIMELHYLEDKSFSFIADTLGYSESWVKKKHLKILKKVSKCL